MSLLGLNMKENSFLIDFQGLCIWKALGLLNERQGVSHLKNSLRMSVKTKNGFTYL